MGWNGRMELETKATYLLCVCVCFFYSNAHKLHCTEFKGCNKTVSLATK